MVKWLLVCRLFIYVCLIFLNVGMLLCDSSSGKHLPVADFYNETSISRIAFGSCSYARKGQPLWQVISEKKPDLWIWLGDAVYADTKIAPLTWIPSSLETMVERFNELKNSIEYQHFLASGINVLGVWDDHDYGMNSGGKHYRDRLQAQGIYLDFLDEPIESLRRKRQGTYVSYTFGHGAKTVKVILLDTRSHLKWGENCDILGDEQWVWLEQQLGDHHPVQLTIVGSGMQILSDMPLTDKWTCCPSSYDRLIWLVQRNPRVVLLSGDVHFGEFSCLNSTSTGYPLYEVTSSGLTGTCVSWMPVEICRWMLTNVGVSTKRIHNFLADLNYGLLTINWDHKPVTVTMEVSGLAGSFLKQTVLLYHLDKKREAYKCPPQAERPPIAKKFLFYLIVCLLVTVVVIGVLRLLVFLLKIFVVNIMFPVLDIRLHAKAPETNEHTNCKERKNKFVKTD